MEEIEDEEHSALAMAHAQHERLKPEAQSVGIEYIEYNFPGASFVFFAELYQRRLPAHARFAFVCTQGEVRSIVSAGVATQTEHAVSTLMSRQHSTDTAHGIGVVELDTLIEEGNICIQDGALHIEGMTHPITHLVVFFDSPKEDLVKINMILKLLSKLDQLGYQDGEGIEIITIVATEQEVQRAGSFVASGDIVNFSDDR